MSQWAGLDQAAALAGEVCGVQEKRAGQMKRSFAG